MSDVRTARHHVRVETVLGPLAPECLGRTSMHEHVLLLEPEVAEADLRAFKAAGGTTLVEATTLGLVDMHQRRQHASRLAQCSRATGVNIVAGTGFYKEPRLPDIVGECDIDRLADHMIGEIQDGIGQTEHRAGIIGEIGTSNYQVFATEEKVLRAAARAHRTTGASITTHTGRATMAHRQLDILQDEGVSLDRVIIGHLDVQPKLAPLLSYYEELASRSAFIQFDTVGKETFFELHLDPAYGQKFPDDAERATIVAELVSRGYIHQILIACDVDTEELTRANGRQGYARLLGFAQELTRVGLRSDQIETLLVDNPRRALSF